MDTGSAHSHGGDTTLFPSGERARGTHTYAHVYLFLYLETGIENGEFTPTHPTQSMLRILF